jgi:general secretion pathway protein D
MKLTSYIRSTLVICATLASLGAFAAETEEGERTWQMATKNADIQEFVAQVAKITGKTFIVDPKLKGQVNVISETPLGKQGVYELFLSVLRLQNYTAVPSGNVVRIQQSATGKQTPGARGGLGAAAPEELVTQIIAVKNVKSEDLLKILRPLIPQYGHIGSVSEPNVVIISDHADNIRRLKKIISDIDVAETNEVVMIALKEAWVGDIVEILEKVAPKQVGSGATGPQKVQLIANERNNSLVLRGQSRPIANLLDIIEKLDQPATTKDATQVILLNHADAENVSNILQSILGSLGSSQPGGGTGGKVNVQADLSLNALIVKADPGAMGEILSIVDKLDSPRAQVLIEAAIVEVTLNNDLSFGAELAAGDQRGQSVPLISTSLNGSIQSLLGGVIDANNPGAVSVVQGLATLSGPTLAAAKLDLDGISFGAVITALSTNSDANLLSTPSIITLDNNEAKILVGREVPFRTGSFTTTGNGSSNPFTTVNRQDVGVELLVTPHVFDGNEVRLDVVQNISNVLPTAVGGSTFADVVTSKRTIETTVLAGDGETIVLGGLIQDDVTETNRRVPVLGSIPLIGNLFKSKTSSRVKTNLLVFIRPTIISSSEQATTLTNKKYSGIWELTTDQKKLNNEDANEESAEALQLLFQGKQDK